MERNGAIVILLVIVFADRIGRTVVHALNGEHVCINEEIYTEVEHQKTMHPVKIRSYNWCMSIPPRCSNYRTELKEVTRIQNVTKSRLIEFCCDGYVEANTTADNRTDAPSCVPQCRGGCGQMGACTAPNVCTCSVGYEGRHCSQRCRFRMYGQGCQKACRCRNGALCDHRTGYCRCMAGWTGEVCDQTCPIGYYGIMCKRVCSNVCASGRCDPQTGICSPARIPAHIIFSTPANRNADAVVGKAVLSPHIMRVGVGANATDGASNANAAAVQALRIKAKHWIAVSGNGKIHLRNCTGIDCRTAAKAATTPPTTTTVALPVDGAQLATLIDQTHKHHVQIHQNHSMMMTALNSSIANLTSDVGKLSQQIGEQHDIQQLLGDEDGKVTLILDTNAVLDVNGAKEVQEPSMVEENSATVKASKSSSDELLDGDEHGYELDNEIVQLFALQQQGSNQSADSQVGHIMMDNPPMVPVVLVVLVALILLSLVAFGLTYIIRRANGSEPVGQQVTRRAQHVQEIKLAEHVVQKPLPDIPSFTQSFTRRAAQHEFYDRPSNNMSIVSGLNTLGYSYTTTTAKHNGGAQLDVVVLPKQQQQTLSSTTPTTTSAANVVDGAIAATTTLSRSKSLEAASRKSSFEHIYDEIKYADRLPSVVMLK